MKVAKVQKASAARSKSSSSECRRRARPQNNEDNFVVCNLTTGSNPDAALCNHELGPRGRSFWWPMAWRRSFGEVASQICVTTFQAPLRKLEVRPHDRETNFVLLLREAVEFANQIIFQKPRATRTFGYGCTATARRSLARICLSRKW